jgi:hypothetical protein
MNPFCGGAIMGPKGGKLCKSLKKIFSSTSYRMVAIFAVQHHYDM